MSIGCSVDMPDRQIDKLQKHSTKAFESLATITTDTKVNGVSVSQHTANARDSLVSRSKIIGKAIVNNTMDTIKESIQ